MQLSCKTRETKQSTERLAASCDSVATGVSKTHRRSLLQELSNRGVRITPQRRLVIETIQDSTNHLDAASLLELAHQRAPGIDRATVYRTLELLKKLGLIDELDLMHLHGEKHYYEAKTAQAHIHLACFHCRTIQEFSSPLLEQLKEEIAQHTGFQSRVIRLELGGACKACVSGLSQPAAPDIDSKEERSYQ